MGSRHDANQAREQLTEVQQGYENLKSSTSIHWFLSGAGVLVLGWLLGLASRGYYSGPTRVVHGLEDFNEVQPGDVLVIPFSDVSWSVLFTRAKAIIAESGGMLSHSSILAREYQIPAVVSVHGAMQLQDEMLVTVDGYRGEVILHTKAAIQQNEVSNRPKGTNIDVG